MSDPKQRWVEPHLVEMKGYHYLVDALLDIYILTRDPKIERKIVDLFGGDLLRRLLEDRETAHS